MKYSFGRFLHDRLITLGVIAAALTVLALFLLAFKTPVVLISFTIIFLLAIYLIALLIEYFRRASFYRNLIQNIEQLDQKYLVLETLERPNFLDGQILYDMLYLAHKSMREEVTHNSAALDDFCEYLELWIHEAKTPISAMSLMRCGPEMSTELATLDNYLEQILYFARSKNAEQDYLFKAISLEQVVEHVLEKNRNILQKHNIAIKVSGLNVIVSSDAKWLEFIINQLLQNSIKYGAKSISISADQQEHQTKLIITDDGIGIPTKDLPRVFEKSFTGQNGRKFCGMHSTGMGLYIVKNLCAKLGHDVSIASPHQSGTEVTLTFHDHDYYKNVISM